MVDHESEQGQLEERGLVRKERQQSWCGRSCGILPVMYCLSRFFAQQSARDVTYACGSGSQSESSGDARPIHHLTSSHLTALASLARLSTVDASQMQNSPANWKKVSKCLWLRISSNRSVHNPPRVYTSRWSLQGKNQSCAMQ